MTHMVNVRKTRAGTDSAGYTWPTDGAVIEVPVGHALMLARIPDGGFRIIEREPEADGGTESSAVTTTAPVKPLRRQTES